VQNERGKYGIKNYEVKSKTSKSRGHTLGPLKETKIKAEESSKPSIPAFEMVKGWKQGAITENVKKTQRKENMGLSQLQTKRDLSRLRLSQLES